MCEGMVIQHFFLQIGSPEEIQTNGENRSDVETLRQDNFSCSPGPRVDSGRRDEETKQWEDRHADESIR